MVMLLLGINAGIWMQMASDDDELMLWEVLVIGALSPCFLLYATWEKLREFRS